MGRTHQHSPPKTPHQRVRPTRRSPPTHLGPSMNSPLESPNSRCGLEANKRGDRVVVHRGTPDAPMLLNEVRRTHQRGHLVAVIAALVDAPPFSATQVEIN